MKRKLSSVERTIWKRGVISLNIVTGARIKGHIHADALRKAWLVLQEKHPLLQVHLQEDARSILLTSEGSSAIPVREADASDGETSWQKEALAELQHPFTSFSKEPLVRSVLLHSSDHDDLLISCHHCISDGLSTTFLLRDLLHCLVGQEQRVVPSTGIPFDKTTIPSSVKLSFPVRSVLQTASFLSSIFLKPLHSGREIVMADSRLLSWTADQHETTSFLAACKEKKVSVHSAITALFQAAQFTVQGNKKSFFDKVYTPVSVRDRLSRPVGEAFGLYASETYVPCRYNPEEDFWQNTRRIQKSIKAYLSDSKIFTLVLAVNSVNQDLLDRLLIYLLNKQSIRFGYIISNLGRLDFPAQYGDLTLTAIHGPIIYVPCAEKTLTLSMFEQKLSFSLTYQPGTIGEETIHQLQEEAMALFHRLGSINP